MTINKDKWYTITELMILGKERYVPFKSREVWTKLCKENVIPHLRKGRTHLIRGKELLKYLEDEIKKSYHTKSYDPTKTTTRANRKIRPSL